MTIRPALAALLALGFLSACQEVEDGGLRIGVEAPPACPDADAAEISGMPVIEGEDECGVDP